MSEAFDLSGFFGDRTGPHDGFSGEHSARMRKSGSFEIPFSWQKFMDDNTTVIFDPLKGRLVIFDLDILEEDAFCKLYQDALKRFSEKAVKEQNQVFRYMYPIKTSIVYDRARINLNVFSFPDFQGYLGDVPVSVTLEGHKHYGIIKPTGDLWVRKREDINLQKAIFAGSFCHALHALKDSKTPVQKIDTIVRLSDPEQNPTGPQPGGA